MMENNEGPDGLGEALADAGMTKEQLDAIFEIKVKASEEKNASEESEVTDGEAKKPDIRSPEEAKETNGGVAIPPPDILSFPKAKEGEPDFVLPIKFNVKAEDGTIDPMASLLNAAKSQFSLERKLGSMGKELGDIRKENEALKAKISEVQKKTAPTKDEMIRSFIDGETDPVYEDFKEKLLKEGLVFKAGEQDKKEEKEPETEDYPYTPEEVQTAAYNWLAGNPEGIKYWNEMLKLEKEIQEKSPDVYAALIRDLPQYFSYLKNAVTTKNTEKRIPDAPIALRGASSSAKVKKLITDEDRKFYTPIANSFGVPVDEYILNSTED